MSEIALARPTASPHAGAGEIAVPCHSLARRSRGWTLWLLVLALLAWSWGPAEMFRAASLLTDWRNMAEFGRAFLHPNFHEWDSYLADMIVTVQIAVWGTALARRAHGLAPDWGSSSERVTAADRVEVAVPMKRPFTGAMSA